MHAALIIVQIVLAILLAIFILVQERGGGMGEAIGGAGGAGFQTSKRGAEKVLAQATVVLLAAFVLVSLALNFI